MFQDDTTPPDLTANSPPDADDRGRDQTSVAGVRQRPMYRQAMHLIRRGHLYLGLFLFPWALLYGLTAFLFNHPTIFNDQPTTTFGPEALAGTPAAELPSPTVQAEQVVARLNELKQPATPFKLSGAAKYGGREFAFATVKAEGFVVSVLIDLNTRHGTVRMSPAKESRDSPKAPFATGVGRRRSDRSGGPGGRSTGRDAVTPTEGVKLETPLHDRVSRSVPTVLTRMGFPTGEVTVTSVPDLVFPLEAAGGMWIATYNPLTGSITGTPADARPQTELGWRRFLLRLHTAHGYPTAMNGRWFWAVVVDAMALTMCFWGLSGLMMWWQLKATRRLGLVILVVSFVAASTLGIAMHMAVLS